MFGVGGKKSRKKMSGAERFGAALGDAIGDALVSPLKQATRKTKPGYKHDYAIGRKPKSR